MNWFFRRRAKKKSDKNDTKPFKRQALCFQALEPRLLLSADALGGVIDADDLDVGTPLLTNYDKIREDLHNKLLQPNVQGALLSAAVTAKVDASDDQGSYAKFDLSSLNSVFPSDHTPDTLVELVDVPELPEQPIEQLVFVSDDTPELDKLLGESLRNPSIQIITIGSAENALESMTSEITKYENLDAIHVISHGSSGSLSMGVGKIDSEALKDANEQEWFSQWHGALAKDADLLIYGCNFAEGDDGQKTLTLFSELTGLNAAASDDATGSSIFDGDWDLEQTVGLVDTQLVVSLDVQETWAHSLDTIVVNTADDINDLGWGVTSVADLIANESEISLREALAVIRDDVGWGGSGEVHTIEFDLADDTTINLSSALPGLSNTVIIKGLTDAEGTPIVSVVGNGFYDVFNITADDVEIYGLEIRGGLNGISIEGDSSTVSGNYIVDNDYYGINISGASNQIGGDQVLERNIISGNGSSGVFIAGGNANNNTIQGNYIGLDADGLTARGNGTDGITLNTSSGTLIGGSEAGAGNVISGNDSMGIEIFRTGTIPSNHTILGNIVGLDASGTVEVGNLDSGMEIYEARYVTVGDGSEEGRNIVSGNQKDGIKIIGENTEFITVSGNYIGTDITGQVALGNGQEGILVYDGPGADSFYNVGIDWEKEDTARIYIGGAQASDGNVISGNGWSGIAVAKDASYVGIVNNIIGLDVNAESAMGNGRHGVWVNVGEESFGYDAQVFVVNNQIAHNARDGIVVEDDNTYGVYMRQNQIFANGEMGIELGMDEITDNDTADLDAGPNRLFNFPEFTSVQIIDGELNIQGDVNYHSNMDGMGVIVEFYYASTIGDNGSAHATAYIGSHTVYSTPSSFDLSFDVEIPSGAYITATIIADNVGTSEFSRPIQLAQGNISNQAPTGSVTLSGALLQGAILTAGNSLSDGNGMSSPIKYQWRRGGVSIEGANDSEYTLLQADVGELISVDAIYTDDDGYEEIVSSVESGTIGNVNDVATGTVKILGERTEDEQLSAEYSFTDPDGLSGDYSYQWYRDGSAISGATELTYDLSDDDVGSQISVTVRYTDLLNSNESMGSSDTVAIANVNDAPQGDVSISGTLMEDQTLYSQLNITDSDGLPSGYDYQWYRDDVSISGANADTYTLVDEDVGSVIKFSVSYEDLQGAKEIVYSSDSTAVGNLNDTPVGSLDIDGSNVEGETLSAQVNFTDPDGLSGTIDYQWYRDNVAISGAIGDEYIIINGDVGSRLSVTATYLDDSDVLETISSTQTNPVNNTNQAPIGDVSITGNAEEDSTLTVNRNFSDVDGLPSDYNYQWYRAGASIVGADQDSYMLVDADVGSLITVEVSYVDNLGSSEAVLSSATTSVLSVNDFSVGDISITGSNIEGQIITGLVNLNDDDGLPSVYDYQWLRNGVDIAGENAISYELTEQDVGNDLMLSVTYTDLQNYTQTVQSSSFGPIANLNQAAVGSVDISGIEQEDGTLSAALNFTDNDGLPSDFLYQWYRDGAVIESAIEDQYQLSDEDVGSQLSVAVQYIDGHGSEEILQSNLTGLIENTNDLPTGNLLIIGEAEEGQQLSIDNNVADEDGIDTATFEYQWYRDGIAIVDATQNEYLLQNADVGTSITVVMQYQDLYGQTETVTSLALSEINNLNTSPEGSVTITGNAIEDEGLTLTHNLSDADGMSGDYSYQWYRDDSAISGENSSTLLLSDIDVGASILVIVSYTDGFGTEESVASTIAGSIAGINDSPTGSVVISGSAIEDQTLTLSDTLVDVDGISTEREYRWYRDGTLIEGATADTYTLSDIDVGGVIHAEMRYTDDQGFDELILVGATEVVENINDVANGGLLILGAAQEGQLLTLENNITDDDGLTGAFNYQWFRDGVVIQGENNDFYSLQDDDVNTSITVSAQYQDAHGEVETVISQPLTGIENINSLPNGEITVTGSVEEDQQLRVTHNIVDEDGISGAFQYQWFRDGTQVSGANGNSFLMGDDDVGSSIYVLVSYTDEHGTEESLASIDLGPVKGLNDTPEGTLSIAGNYTEDETLSVLDSISDVDGISSREYKWYRNGDQLEGAAGANFVLTDEDVGAQIFVELVYTDNQGFEEVVRAESQTTVANINDAPSGSVNILGSLLEGATLLADPSIQDVDGLPSTMNFQWFRGEEAIEGAVEPSYQLNHDDVGSQLSVVISYTDSQGTNETVLSHRTNLVLAVEQDSLNELDQVSEITELDKEPESGAESDKEPVEGETVAEVTDENDENLLPQKENVASNAFTSEVKDIFTTADRFAAGVNFSVQNGTSIFEFNAATNNEQQGELEVTEGIHVVWAPDAIIRAEGAIPKLNDLLNILNKPEYNDNLQKSMQELKDNNITFSNKAIGGTAAATTGLSVGYLLWTLRSGVLMTSLLSSLPAWRFIDPLPVLGGTNQSEEDDESLESMVEVNKASEPEDQGVDRV